MPTSEQTDIGPGLHAGMSFEQYFNLPYLNSSRLQILREHPPSVFKWHTEHPGSWSDTETDSLRAGRALHSHILEPDAGHVVKGPDKVRRGTKAWKAVEDEHPGAVVLKPEEWNTLEQQTVALYENDMAFGLLTGGIGQSEVTAVWDTAPYGTKKQVTRCKARLDRIADFEGYAVIADLKSMREVSDRAIRKVIGNYGYHIQAAWYLRALDQLAPGPRRRRYFIVAVTTDEPFICRVFEPDAESIETGARLVGRFLQTYQLCTSTGNWPGYETEGIASVGLESWHVKEE